MGGIAAGTQSGSIHGHHEEPDIDMPEPDTPASDDSDSDEAEGNNIYYPSKSKGGRCGLSGSILCGPMQDAQDRLGQPQICPTAVSLWGLGLTSV